MGKESQRRRKIAKKRKRNQRMTRPSTSVNDLGNDLLETILLGLDTPVCLVRAASTCKRWRHIVAVAAFLRWFRSLHPPRAIGHFHSVGGDPPCSFVFGHTWPKEPPVYVPVSASAAAAGTIYGRQLSLDFVPYQHLEKPPELVESRGSLLLLLKQKFGTAQAMHDCMCCDHLNDNIVPDLVVCEPLTRRYQRIDPPEGRVCILGAFLLDGDDIDDDDEAGCAISIANFRVLLVLYNHDFNWFGELHNGHGHVSASVFTSGRRNGGSWYHGHESDDVYMPLAADVQLAGRTGGRIYWGCYDKQVMVLDEHTLEFSTMALPDRMKWNFNENNFQVIAGEGGAARIVRVTEGGDLEFFRQVYGCYGDEYWVPENMVRLAEATRGLRRRKEEYFTKPARIMRAGEGSVVLSPVEKTWLFSVDVDTMELKRVPRRNRCTGPAFPCMTPWPPVMLACVNKGPKKRKKKASN